MANSFRLPCGIAPGQELGMRGTRKIGEHEVIPTVLEIERKDLVVGETRKIN